MSTIINQQYGNQAVRNHYYGPRLYQPDPYPHGSRLRRRTWCMYTFPNAPQPPYPPAIGVPVYAPWAAATPPAPIIINNCACARSAPINTNVPAPGPTQRTEAVHADSGATAPLYGFEAQNSAEPDMAKLASNAFQRPMTGVRARDILPTIRPPRGPRVETPPPSPPPRRSTRQKVTYDGKHSFASEISPGYRPLAVEEGLAVDWDCDPPV